MSAINRLRRLEQKSQIRPRPARRLRMYEYTAADGRRVIEIDLTGAADLPAGAIETPSWNDDR